MNILASFQTIKYWKSYRNRYIIKFITICGEWQQYIKTAETAMAMMVTRNPYDLESIRSKISVRFGFIVDIYVLFNL